MTKQQPRIYTYKITFEEVPHYYYGVHKEDRFDEYYMGTPVTHKWMWDFYTPQKQVLELFDFSDEGYKEAAEVETRLIRPVYNTDPLCLNENCGGVPSLEVCRRIAQKHKENGTGIFGMSFEELSEAGKKGGKITGTKMKENGTGIFGRSPEAMSEDGRKGAKVQMENQIGIFGFTTEQRSEIGKRSGEKHKENGTGIFSMTSEKRREACKKGTQTQRENKLGLFGLTPEQRSENGKKSGKICYEKGVGFHALTKEQRSEIGKRAGQKHKENGTGIFSMTREQRVENGKKAGKIVNAQRWQCTVTGHVSTPGPLSLYQKARGIDTSNRIRLQ
jgi:general stress protein YciG